MEGVRRGEREDVEREKRSQEERTEGKRRRW